MILVIPVVAVLLLATDRIVQDGQQAFDNELVRALAELSSDASAVSHEVHREGMTAAAFLADPAGKPDQYIPQIRRTDRVVAAYIALRQQLGDVPDTVNDRLRRIDQQLTTLDDARQQVLTRADLTVSAVVLRYEAVTTDLVAYREAIGQIAGDTPLGDSLRAVAALSKAKDEMAQAQSVAFVALQSKQLDDEALTSFLSTQTSQQESLGAFFLVANADQRAFVSATITGDAVALADRAASDVIRSSGRPDPLISPAEASRSLGSVVDLVRWAEERLDNELLIAATESRNEVILQVLIDGAAVLIVLFLALALALILAGSLVRSLNVLRMGTLAVANRDLPETVARLSDRRTLGDHTPAEIAAQVPDPIQLSSKDEIGQVALAFNVVHREAVRVAAEQAALHTSVSMMFLNLARRSQSLVDQMIAHLDDIERDEQDPKRLARLFRLDHLATRMRRNDENLLVLAGADSSPARRDDGVVVDILRAAQSEIEHYDRVEFDSIDQDAMVTARAVNDVVRLLAELFDNATRFSPPGASVVVGARRIGDQVIVQIEDRGVGMTAEQVDVFNTRLASPPAVDISAFRMMGLAVASRLAARYGIRIELRCDTGEGTTVYVTLPGPIVILPRSRGYDSFPAIQPRQPVDSLRGAGGQHGPRQPLAVPAGPSWHDMIPAALPSGPVAGGGPLPWTDSPRHTSNGGLGAAMGDHHSPMGMHSSPGPGPGYAPPPPPPPAPDDTAEMPIYQEMAASWFGSPGGPDLGNGGASPRYEPSPRGVATPPPPPPRQAQPTSEMWRSPADEGWRAAFAASAPPVRTQTVTGLPKRVPQAQLVPGGVDTGGPATQVRRTPDDVRGLLSNYHRGVQRGRGLEEPPVSG